MSGLKYLSFPSSDMFQKHYTEEGVPRLLLRGTTGQQIQLRLLCVEEVIRMLKIILIASQHFYLFCCPS